MILVVKYKNKLETYAFTIGTVNDSIAIRLLECFQVFMLRGSQCPSMLKDLLVTTELTSLLGPEVVHAI